jgi:DNA ligase (NAD+)
MHSDTIKRFLTKASEAYYRGTEWLIDNDQFDRLSEIIKYSEIGYKVDGTIAKHQYQMFSLEKVYGKKEDLGAPWDNDVVESPKLDGAAVSLLYVEGDLVQVLTRGDGISGNIITDKAQYISGIPTTNMYGLCQQVTGEIVATKENINSRNYVSGALSLKSLEEFKTRKLRFIAYDVQPKLTLSYKKDLRFLENHSFDTIISRNVKFEDYPSDGIVIRIDSNTTFDSLGYTSHHPRGAIAVKERKEAVITTLLNVIWQVGKSGRVTPVAILEPVDINGAIVSKATLNNVHFLKSLNLYIGCKVEVIRSGEIIPTIVGRAQ